ncbi:MAG: cobalamin-binding protein [Spartobacteria bacterium]|nr:cobalamin-binding protein [Spartobacteria bacterium]
MTAEAIHELKIQQLTASLLALDYVSVKSLLKDEIAEQSALLTIEKLLVPALDRIGGNWDEGTAALSQVYMSGRLCEKVLNSLMPQETEWRLEQPKMAIAVLEDYHFLGKRMLITEVMTSGYFIKDYGNMSVDSLIAHCIKDQLDGLMISTLMLPSALQAKKVITQLRVDMPELKIIVGGAPFRLDPSLWQEVGADAMGSSIGDALLFIKTLKGGKQ